MNTSPTQCDPRTTQELVNTTLTNDEDAADSIYWDAMRELHRRGTVEVFNAAKSLCESPCPVEQRIGCVILAQLGGSESPFASRSFPLVVSVMERVENLDTLASALCALGWFGDPRGVSHVLPYLDHPDSDIRYWVTHALTALREDQRSIDGLIHLSSDAAAEVRDWATCGLGSLIDRDSPAIREALIARLGDLDDIVRGEALVGLAKRQDSRVIEPLRQALEARTFSKTANDYAGEALDALENLDQYPQLLAWKMPTDRVDTTRDIS